jgi:hypothetical protein
VVIRSKATNLEDLLANSPLVFLVVVRSLHKAGMETLVATTCLVKLHLVFLVVEVAATNPPAVDIVLMEEAILEAEAIKAAQEVVEDFSVA